MQYLVLMGLILILCFAFILLIIAAFMIIGDIFYEIDPNRIVNWFKKLFRGA